MKENKYYWRVELMRDMMAKYEKYLLSGQSDLAERERNRIDEFSEEMARDIFLAHEKIIKKNKKIQEYQAIEDHRIREIMKLQGTNSQIINALKYYADKRTYAFKESENSEELLEGIKTTPIAQDQGERARKTLDEIKKGDGEDEET